jgi:membrane fusion protein (multidrug efflux system)
MLTNKKVCGALFLLIFVSSCQENEKKQKLEVFPTTKPIIIDTTAHLDYVAEISATKNIEIRSMLHGYLSKVHVDEGQVVQEGQILFSINNASYKEELIKCQALLKIAEAEVQSAKLEVQNTKELVQKNVISEIELEFSKNKLQIVRARVEEANANVAHAKLMLNYTEIRAPFRGIINRLPQKIGSLVEDGTLLTTLSQSNEIFAYFDISEQEYLNFSSWIMNHNNESEKVKLLLANGELFNHLGEIETIDSEIDQRTGNISVRSRFPNPDLKLKHGASGKLRITQNFKQVLVIPQKSMFEIQDKTFVYIVDKSNKIRMQQIEISNRLPHILFISSGLKTTDQIIYEGIQGAADGLEIKPKFNQQRSIFKKLNKFRTS